MSQSDFGTIDPGTKSGTALAADLNGFRDALHSMHGGAARPTYAVAGMLWKKEVSGTQHEIYFYDGTSDLLMYTVNPTAHTITPISAGLGNVNNWTARQAWSIGTSIASSTTITIPTNGNFFHLTGTANVTAINSIVGSGPVFIVHDAAHLITHNATSLSLPGNANITAAAGDVSVWMHKGSGNWRCVSYIKVNGQAVVSPASSDEKAKVSANDTTAGYLATKVTSTGGSVTITEVGDGGDETLNLELAALSVSQGDINTATASQSVGVSVGAQNTITPTGGIWTFQTYARNSQGTINRGYYAIRGSGASDAAIVAFYNDDASNITAHLYSHYITASPPYDLGDGEVPYFIYALVKNGTGEVVGTYAAQDPPWAYNGKNRINPKKTFRRNGKQYILEKDLQGRTARGEKAKGKAALSKFIDDYVNTVETPQELTMARKMAGAADIPHPWFDQDLAGKSIILLDPMDDALVKMRELLLYDEIDITQLLHDGDIIIDTNPLPGRKVPNGVKAHGWRWR